MKSEKELALELGIDRKMLAGWRKDGIISTSSSIKVGNQITYHEEGEHEVRNIVQRELMVQELSAPLPQAADPVEMEITSIPRNPKMVLCGDLRVKVRENKNFLLGMKVKARPSTDNKQVWVMVGRCPRWRGRY
jgi:hypothetical protein